MASSGGISSLAGLTAIVTGAAGGMGRELAVQLAGAGCNVAMCDVRAAPLEETRVACAERARGNHFHTVRVSAHHCDVSSRSSIAELRRTFAAAHGARLDLLFNNAGITSGGSFLEIERERFDKVMGVNLHGVVEMTRAFLPLIIASQSGCGAVVNISSINAFWSCLGPARWPVAVPPHAPYSASKAAVRAFTEALLVDSYANFPHVNVVSVHPGHVGTDIAVLQLKPPPVDRRTKLLRQNSTPQQFGEESRDEVEDEVNARRATSEAMRLEELRAITRVMTRGALSERQLKRMSADELIDVYGTQFRERAPLSAAAAAAQIISGVVRGETRVLVGEDAFVIDWLSRAFPRLIYKDWFIVSVLAPWSLSAARIGPTLRGRYWFPLLVAAAAYAAKALAMRALFPRSKL